LEQEPQVFTVPRLVTENLEKKVHDRIERNRTRHFKPGYKPKHHYLLQGYIRCRNCNVAMVGEYHGKKRVYRHQKKKDECSDYFYGVPSDLIEVDVLKSLTKGIKSNYWVDAFKDELPDQKKVKKIRKRIERTENKIKKTREKRMAVLSDYYDLKDDDLKSLAANLLRVIEQDQMELENDRELIRDVPTDEVISRAAKEVTKVFRGKVGLGNAARRIRNHDGDREFPSVRRLFKDLFIGKNSGIFVEKYDEGWRYDIRGAHHFTMKGKVLNLIYQHE
jgi:hypothetical protein